MPALIALEARFAFFSCICQAKMKGHTGPSQKHLYSRTSYLYQAATFLANIKRHASTKPQTLAGDGDQLHIQPAEDESTIVEADSAHKPTEQDGSAREALSTAFPNQPPLSRLLVHHLKAVSLKAQIRVSPEMKHSMCKRCDSILVAGKSATYTVENRSRGGKKPWADVLVVTCNSCGALRRFPVGAKRQRKRQDRKRPDEIMISAT